MESLDTVAFAPTLGLGPGRHLGLDLGAALGLCFFTVLDSLAVEP